MYYVMIDAIRNVMAYWILILIMQYICSADLKLNKITCLICNLIIIPVFILFAEYSFLCMPLLIILTVLLFSKRRGRDILLFFLSLAFYLAFTIIPDCLLTELFPALSTPIMIGTYPLSLIGGIMDIVLLVALIVLRYVLLKYETTLRLTPKEIWGAVGLVFFLMVVGGFLVNTHFAAMKPVFVIIWKVLYLGAFVLSVGYYLFSLISSRVRIYRQTLARNEAEYLRVQLDALQDIKENEAQVKHLRHDLSNHLTVIHSLCEEGNYDEIRTYTEHLRKDIVLPGSNVLTGNKVADLVVHSKMKAAREQNIEFSFNGSLAHLSSLDAPDICGLLANAYDNAIEACRTQENPYIRTTVSTTRNYTVIQIVNSVTHKIPIRANRIATTKKEKDAHGYGIDIMHRIARKYKGNCTLSCSDNEFCLKIVLLTNAEK